MPTSCCAFGCSNNSLKTECIERKVSFHRFPHNKPELMKQWLNNIKREDFVPTKHTKICSDHFEPHLFYTQKTNNIKMLVADAVPTLFSFRKPVNKQKIPS